MSWASAVLPAITAAALLLVPGYIIARIIALRGLWAWAFAAPASATVIVLASLWTPFVSMRWTLLPVGITALVVMAVAFVLRKALRVERAARPSARSGRTTLWALLGAGVILTVQLVLIVGDANNISQSFDNIFHLNAVRYIMDTGSASPMTIGAMTSPDGGLWFYPDGWHALVALVAETSGASIMIASNATMIVVAAVVWPASVLLLTRVTVGGHRVVTLTAGVVAAIIPVFPIMMIDYGVLYPYFLAVSLLPAVLAATIELLGLGSRSTRLHRGMLFVALLGSLPGVVIAHPGAFVAWIVLAMATATLAYARFLRERPARPALVRVSVFFVLTLAVAAVAWKVLKPAAEARGWPVEQSVGQAIGQALTLSPTYGNVTWVPVVLLIVGAAALVRRWTLRSVLPVVLYAIVAILYIVASAMPWPTLRDLITAAWYNNSPRLAALLPMLVVPIAAYGGHVVAAWVRRVAVGEAGARRPVVAVLAGVAVVLLGGQLYTNQQAIRYVSAVYAYSDESRLVSTDELELMERLPEEVPEDAVIAGSGWTGAGMAYAFADRRVTMPHVLMEFTDDEQLILDELSRAEPGSAVCDAIERTGTTYVLDFGVDEIHGAKHEYDGLRRLAASDALTLVDSEGSAKLYEVTGC
ncbi:DUF6541 family protein [Microbacterium sp. H83]|uniref:DUF6541 family protein n=1 Tax=Microbacterium sp. H83 TaxID=1827324 RepID=UPI0007F42225|nr:DUF6541 family protein [Microbacterium sp. H83]OAN41285.1 hypothetical protein A4X16_11435 [Microbacterium sp. H83]